MDSVRLGRARHVRHEHLLDRAGFEEQFADLGGRCLEAIFA